MQNQNSVPSVLTVKAKEIRTSTNPNTAGKKYAYLVMVGDEKEAITLPGGNTFMATKRGVEGAFIAWEQNNLPTPVEDFGWKFQVGEPVLGAKVTRSVTPYPITDKVTGEVNTVNTYSAIVL